MTVNYKYRDWAKEMKSHKKIVYIQKVSSVIFLVQFH